MAFGGRGQDGDLARPPACSRGHLDQASPMPSVVAWLMKMSRQSLAASESKVTTLILAAAGLVERRADRVRVVRGDDDDVLLLLDQRVDVADLRRGAGVVRADLLVLALELADRDLAAAGLDVGSTGCSAAWAGTRSSGPPSAARSGSPLAAVCAAAPVSAEFVLGRAAAGGDASAGPRPGRHGAGAGGVGTCLVSFLDLLERRTGGARRRCQLPRTADDDVGKQDRQRRAGRP